MNIIDILTRVASLTSSGVYGPGDASKPLASLEGTLPFALDQATAAFVCRALDLFLLFLTGKDQLFSNFFKVQGRHALSALVDTHNKHLFSSALGPATFVRLSMVVRDVLQTLQQRARRGFSDHFDVDISALVGLDFFASSFLDDAKVNYETNERFLTGSSLFRQISAAGVSLAALAHAGGAFSSSLRKAPKRRQRGERGRALPGVSGEDLSALDVPAWGQDDDLPLPSSPKKPKVPQEQPAADISSEEESNESDESDDSSSSD